MWLRYQALCIYYLKWNRPISTRVPNSSIYPRFPLSLYSKYEFYSAILSLVRCKFWSFLRNVSAIVQFCSLPTYCVFAHYFLSKSDKNFICSCINNIIVALRINRVLKKPYLLTDLLHIISVFDLLLLTYLMINM